MPYLSNTLPPKCILQMFDMYGTLRPYHLHHIKPDINIRQLIPHKVMLGGADYFVLLCGGYGLTGQAVFVGMAGFYFDENKIRAIPGNEVDFPGSDAVIAVQNGQAFFYEIILGGLLAV